MPHDGCCETRLFVLDRGVLGPRADEHFSCLNRKPAFFMGMREQPKVAKTKRLRGCSDHVDPKVVCKWLEDEICLDTCWIPSSTLTSTPQDKAGDQGVASGISGISVFRLGVRGIWLRAISGRRSPFGTEPKLRGT